MICLNVYMSTVCMSGGYGSQKRTSDFLELELWMICMILNHNVGSENWTWVFDQKKHLLLLTAKLSLQCYLLYFKIFYLLIYLCRQIHLQVVVKKQLVGVSFPFLLCRSWGSALIFLAWWQMPFTAEPFHHWSELFLLLELSKCF